MTTGKKKKLLAVFEPLLSPLYNTAILVTENTEEAEDLFESLLRRAVDSFAQQPEVFSPRVWLYQLLVVQLGLNKHAEFISAPNDREGEREVFFFYRQLLASGQVLNGALTEAWWDQLGNLLVAAIKDLPVWYRLLIVLRDTEGFTDEEIAFILNMPVDMITDQLALAKYRLQKRMWRMLSIRDGWKDDRLV